MNEEIINNCIGVNFLNGVFFSIFGPMTLSHPTRSFAAHSFSSDTSFHFPLLSISSSFSPHPLFISPSFHFTSLFISPLIASHPLSSHPLFTSPSFHLPLSISSPFSPALFHPTTPQPLPFHFVTLPPQPLK